MGGMADSLGGFLGLSGGPSGSPIMGNNEGIDKLTELTRSKRFQDLQDPNAQSALEQGQIQGNPLLMQGLNNLQSQYGRNQGLQDSQTGILDKLQNQGFQLTPEDHTMYGQASGDLARLFGSAGNQTANNLAQRGLSSSGAAGAMFSGLQGSQNEQLAKAQQNIMQQRFQNTMNQIGQQQQFLSSLGQQAGGLSSAQSQLGQSAMQGQSQRNHQNMADYVGTLGGYAGLTEQNHQGIHSQDMQNKEFVEQNKPKNWMDFWTAGTGQGTQAATAKMTESFGSMGSMFGGGGMG